LVSGSDKQRSARADVLRETYERERRERELAAARVEIRADLRDAGDEEEDSAVIDQKMLAVKAHRELSTVPETPIPEKITAWHIAHTAVRRVPPIGLVALGLAFIAAVVALKLAGKLP
jgi:hypothetical protein